MNWTSRIFKTYCCTAHCCRITSIINQQLHLHNFHIKHLKSLRHVSILSDHHQGALLFLSKVILQYSKFNSFLQTRCCGSMSCCVGMCCRESSWLGVCRMLQHIPTQHDMLPQQLVCKNELNCEYCNITLARNNKALWWWSDKIETCRSDFKCFESVLCESYTSAIVGWKQNKSHLAGQLLNSIHDERTHEYEIKS